MRYQKHVERGVPDRISMPKKVAEVFEIALVESICLEREQFGLCLYNPITSRIVDAVPSRYFAQNGYIDADCEQIQCNDRLSSLMKIAVMFNRGVMRTGSMMECIYLAPGSYNGGTGYVLHRGDGVIFPYHTHIGENDFFSSNGTPGCDADFTFKSNDMMIDLVVSEEAKRRGIYPPLCATFNNSHIPFREENMPNYDKGWLQLIEIEEQRSLEEGTLSDLILQQRTKRSHMTIDFIIDE